ncbi:hypothetical protein F0L68_33490 [Solihabitans fulvus]|uniref:Uncharacterized protein n=1 Tax=Solihabitans fulvus TaxID=1892852 RepID=A0A5B2WQS8_9PSEU|nr:hypothetical protein [Solihabitans fulvus]KAA2253324.1 hypothetical protein F0L68_33490 [Solihabitans fulvus]
MTWPDNHDTHASLRWLLQRLAEDVARDEPAAAAALSEDLVGMLGNITDHELVERYRKVGGRLIELGTIYLGAADLLDHPTVQGRVVKSDAEASDPGEVTS